MYFMLVIIITAATSTSSVIYFPTQAACANAQNSLKVALTNLPQDAHFQISCIPLGEKEKEAQP